MRLSVLLLALLSLVGCASYQDTTATANAHIVDAIPSWLGGLPAGVPPRRGTREYDAWQAERATEAVRPKNGPKPEQTPAAGN